MIFLFNMFEAPESRPWRQFTYEVKIATFGAA